MADRKRPTDAELACLQNIQRRSGMAAQPSTERSCEANGWTSNGELTVEGEAVIAENAGRKFPKTPRNFIGQRRR